jgi:hypothetical protein
MIVQFVDERGTIAVGDIIVKTSLKVFWFGLFIYVASFCLVALVLVSPAGNRSLFGFASAFMAFTIPLTEIKLAIINSVPFSFPIWVLLCIFVSGWTNLVFLATVVLDLVQLHPRAVSALRVVVLSMIPFNWIIAFYVFHTYPREGHFLWIIGMLLVLFSEPIGASFNS